MKYRWIDEYLLAKIGVTKNLQADWNWVCYHVGGKMFAAVLLDRENKPYYINLKLEPLEGELMRQQYPDVIPRLLQQQAPLEFRQTRWERAGRSAQKAAGSRL